MERDVRKKKGRLDFYCGFRLVSFDRRNTASTQRKRERCI